MAPSSKQEARLRQAVLALAGETEFAKRMINGGRLSTPSVYATPLSTPDRETWTGGPPPGASVKDAPLLARGRAETFLSEAIRDRCRGFSLLAFANGAATEAPEGIEAIGVGHDAEFADPSGTLAAALRREPGIGLSAAARRLCRGAVSPADPPRARGRAGPRLRIELR